MTCGDTFLIEDEDGLKEHLQVVLSHPDENEEFVTTSICTRQSRMESIVIVQPGHHPFIRRESVAAYRHARIRHLSSVETAFANGIAHEREAVSNALLFRLQKGLVDSDFTRNDVRAYFANISAAKKLPHRA